MSERRELASHCRIDVFNQGAVLAREGDCEEKQGRVMRQMYILVQGDLAVSKLAGNVPGSDNGAATRIASSASDASSMSDDVVSRAAAEANRMEEKKWGKRLAVVSKPGSLFGERQLLFGDPWPVTVRGMTSVRQSHTRKHFSRPVASSARLAKNSAVHDARTHPHTRARECTPAHARSYTHTHTVQDVGDSAHCLLASDFGAAWDP